MPLLGPLPEALRTLVRLSVADLRAAAAQRKIDLPARATRNEIANLLVRHTVLTRLDTEYRETGIEPTLSFESRDDSYPHIRRLVARHKFRRILDIGCGPGHFAVDLQDSGALPRDGSYLGLDISPAAVDLARSRLAGDLRFSFQVADVENGGLEPLDIEVDGIVISFTLSCLHTHSVHRLFGTIARLHPRTTVLVASTFKSCVDRREGVEPDEARERRAASRWVAGDTAAAEAIWDVRRLLCYRQSVETYYRIVEERTYQRMGQMFWIAKPIQRRRAASRRR
ncbi:MAG TPA: class I SAM-dependent methyltransferase [Kofleriaceae bacterium]|nr:class I SAM-dependent methyltransferase [Kofleriaceae bacterium]